MTTHDKRYHIGLEFCGHDVQKYVLRWCGDYLGAFDSQEQAEASAVAHAIERGHNAPAFTFAGFTWPRTVAMLPRGTVGRRLERYKTPVCGPYYHQPGPLTGDRDNGQSFYLESDFMPGLRWSWCDEIPGDWDETELPPRIRHTGWFTDDFQSETVRGLVFKLPHNRGYLAGWSMGEGMISVVGRHIYPDINSAGYAADSTAEYIAELNREQETESEG